MKKFWNVQIEVYERLPVKAAVLRGRAAERRPADDYRQNPGREVFSLWYGTYGEAKAAVDEALAMNKEQGAAA